jgi:hypothetical protein
MKVNRNKEGTHPNVLTPFPYSVGAAAASSAGAFEITIDKRITACV